VKTKLATKPIEVKSESSDGTAETRKRKIRRASIKVKISAKRPFRSSSDTKEKVEIPKRKISADKDKMVTPKP
jgi:hypothetical protein